MAGGGGTRLWPLSRRKTPKQMLALINQQSLFRNSIERLLPIFTPDRIYISTGQPFVDQLQADAPEIPVENFIVEPYAKDNGPAAALSIYTIHQRNPNAIIAYLASDHYIAKVQTFRDTLVNAAEIAADNRIVTLGITPTFPAIGFGYIQQGKHLGDMRGQDYYAAKRFTEKPDVVRATRFLASGQYTWNSGMFIWRADKAIAEFKRQQPLIHTLLSGWINQDKSEKSDNNLLEIWDKIPKISIDFAIMEDAEDMAVIPVDIGWSDVGSWDALFDVLPRDRFGNCKRGKLSHENVQLDSEGTLVISDRFTVTIGVDDIIVVDSDDALLICTRDRAQDIKQVVEYLRGNDKDQYL